MTVVLKNKFDRYWGVWTAVIMLTALVNFIVFMALAGHFGGDALSGRIDEGRYFLGSHGHYSEVSETIFCYSKIHSISVIVTHSLMFISAAVFIIRDRRTKGTPV